MHFPVHFPRQSRAKRTHFSSCLLLHSDQPTLSSSSALFCAPANPRFLSHQHVLRPSETPTPSTASALVFHSKRTCLPLPKRLPPHCQSVCLPPPTQSSSTTRTFGFLCQHVQLPRPERSASSASTPVFLCQHVRLPLPARSASTTRTFGFLCQHACLPLPARLSSSAKTFVFLCQHVRLFLSEPS